MNFKAGVSFGYNIIQNNKTSGLIPDYSLNSVTYAPTIGLSLVPTNISDDLMLGIYLDLLRGSKQYKDFYHEKSNAGSISNLNFGIVVKY